MARKKRKRSYGTGCVLVRRNGFAIRWRESILMPDGSIRKVQKFEALGCVSKKEASQALQDRLAASKTLRRGPITFSELASNWKTTVLPMYKYSTRKHHADILEKKLLPIFGETRIDRISREQIQRWIAELNSTGYSPNSIDHYHNVLSTILTKAVQWEYIPSNPASGVELPQLVTVCAKWVLTPDQAQQLLSMLSPLPKILVAIAIMTGVRRGELFALRWKCFDESKTTLAIREAIYDGVIDTPKTTKSVRIVPLSSELVRLLQDWQKRVLRSGPEDFIFGTADGKQPKDENQIMRDHIRPACAKLGLPSVSWLTFRRTFATWADQNGVSAKQRGELMGNSAEVNNAVYTQVTERALRSAVERVSAELSASKPVTEKLVTDCSLLTDWVN
jgi:integrase